ncbi:hypothetical protein GOHSU_19_00500 [Gordonia hirsuta DSM 44140 = NBRC 16056]|uniref:Transmembrane protein n=1 Tax=Gordonia hirsuta DSM 44140 = NBRC 16056 TaxID=1121927 RepID=L7L8H4_9ACTN|nr:gephyrin-like molybdotransferase receptor GlpR [Gordonia hirsuta]GAC57445.1 hypothetical protein GOHSU_19_00500 [Gordonia hirsuta DSM 44140 = NBRC 16056]
MNSSILWIFLVVAWLFILLPMVLRGRPEVRKTTEAAANTRLLHRGGERAEVRRRAAGRHPSNPDYVRKRARTESAVQRAVIEEATVSQSESKQKTGTTVTVTATTIEASVEVTDVIEVVGGEADDTPAVVDGRTLGEDQPELELDLDLEDEAGTDTGNPDAEHDDDVAELDEELDDELDDEHDAELEDEYDDDLEDDFEDLDEDVSPPARTTPVSRDLRGRGFAPEVIADRDARRYAERRRMVLGLTLATLLAVISCFFWQPYGYLALGVMVVLTGLYLFFLRRTAVAEQQYRAQRAARLRRHAAEDARMARQHAEQLPSRQAAPPRRRPGGMVVLELDDEDPAFDHLPVYHFADTAGADEGLTDDYRHAV